jgi:hypothetical protein
MRSRAARTESAAVYPPEPPWLAALVAVGRLLVGLAAVEV